MSTTDKSLYPVWVEISRSALKNNINELKKNINIFNRNIKFCGVIKSNAYGHGLIETAQIIENDIDFFGVNALWEAIEIVNKLKTTKPIIVLGYTPLNALNNIVNYPNVRIIVYNIETLEKLNQLAEKNKIELNVHIKVETGTGRQGITEEQLPNFILFFKNSKYIKLEGISTHFANIEDTTNHVYYKYQLNKFKEFVELFKQKGIDIPIKHTACTAACILFSDTYFNMIRPGIGLYGLWPSKETYLSCLIEGREMLNLQPVLTFKTKIAQIKQLPVNSYIGYGCTYKTTTPTKIAILPVGYYDGYDRKLSNQGFVIIRNRRAPIIGRICMNITMINITHIKDAQLEDEVILLNSSADKTISTEIMK